MSMNAGQADELLFATQRSDVLPPGARLRVGTVVECVGGGATGHVYRVLDDNRNPIAVREFFPPALSMRMHDRVEPRPQCVATFEAVRRRFDEDGEQLAAFDHPGLLKVHKVWSERGTSYQAMAWCDGRTLEQVVRDAPTPPTEEQVAGWLRAIADALSPVHRERGLHGHVSPSQIMLLDSGRLLLMEFGRARHFLPGDPRDIERDPYAAIECTADGRHGPVGPWTDIYALAGSLHFALRARAPQAPVHRASYDVQEPLRQSIEGIGDTLLGGLDSALALRPRERPRDLARFMERCGLPERRTRPRFSGETLLINLDLPHAAAESPDIALDTVPFDDDFAPTVPPEEATAELASAAVAEPQAELPVPPRVETAEAASPTRTTRAEPAEPESQLEEARFPSPPRSQPKRARGMPWLFGLGAVGALALLGALVLEDDEEALSMSPTAPIAAPTTARNDPPAAVPAASSPIPEPLEPTAAGPAPAAGPTASEPVGVPPPEAAVPAEAPAPEPTIENRAEPAAPAAAPAPMPRPAAGPPRPAPSARSAAPTPAGPAPTAPVVSDEPTATGSPCPGLLARQYVGRPLDAAERDLLRAQCL